jgi:hypothetical protein
LELGLDFSYLIFSKFAPNANHHLFQADADDALPFETVITREIARLTHENMVWHVIRELWNVMHNLFN